MNRNSENDSLVMKSISITGKIIEGIADIVYKCEFENNFNYPINPIHYFSLDSNASVIGLKMKIGERILESIVSEKKIAETSFKTAVDSGISASIFKKLNDTEYKLSVGNVIPGETISIDVYWISNLEINSDGYYKFLLPTNIALKYSMDSCKTNTDLEYLREISNILHSSISPIKYLLDITWSSVYPIESSKISNDNCKIENISDKCIRIKSETNSSQKRLHIMYKNFK